MRGLALLAALLLGLACLLRPGAASEAGPAKEEAAPAGETPQAKAARLERAELYAILKPLQADFERWESPMPGVKEESRPVLDAIRHVIVKPDSTWHFSARAHAHLAHYVERFVYPKGALQAQADKDLYAACQAALARLEAVLYPFIPPRRGAATAWKNGLQGRGIVTLANDAYWGTARVLIHSLRAVHGSRLPVRVYHLGDLSAEHRDELARLPGVRVADLREAYAPGALDLAGYSAKPFAMLASGFAEVLFIDADMMLFAPPASLFDFLEYHDTGVLLFLDRNIPIAGTSLDWVRALVGRGSSYLQSSRLFRGSSNHEVESGVLVYNVARNLYPLLVAARLNTGPDREDTNAHTLGDKETYWLGFEVAQLRWAVSPGDVAGLSFCRGPEAPGNACFCEPRDGLQGLDSPAILHTGPGGEFLFLHFSLAKYGAYVDLPSLYVPGTVQPWFIDGQGRYCVWAPQEHFRTVPPAMLDVYREHVALRERLQAPALQLAQVQQSAAVTV